MIKTYQNTTYPGPGGKASDETTVPPRLNAFFELPLTHGNSLRARPDILL